MLPFISREKDGRCATTSMSAGQTLGSLKVLRPCWTSASMYFRGETLQSRAWVPAGQDLQVALLWSCTAVLVLAAQVNTYAIFEGEMQVSHILPIFSFLFCFLIQNPDGAAGHDYLSKKLKISRKQHI